MNENPKISCDPSKVIYTSKIISTSGLKDSKLSPIPEPGKKPTESKSKWDLKSKRNIQFPEPDNIPMSSIDVLQPIGGKIMLMGANRIIGWRYEGNVAEVNDGNCMIYIKKPDDEYTYQINCYPKLADGTFLWKVGELTSYPNFDYYPKLVPGNYQVRVLSAVEPLWGDSEEFTIGKIELKSPQKEHYYLINRDKINIEWECTNFGGYAKIYLVRYDKYLNVWDSPVEIKNNVPLDIQKFEWTPDETIAPNNGYHIRIYVADSFGSFYIDSPEFVICDFKVRSIRKEVKLGSWVHIQVTCRYKQFTSSTDHKPRLVNFQLVDKDSHVVGYIKKNLECSLSAYGSSFAWKVGEILESDKLVDPGVNYYIVAYISGGLGVESTEPFIIYPRSMTFGYSTYCKQWHWKQEIEHNFALPELCTMGSGHPEKDLPDSDPPLLLCGYHNSINECNAGDTHYNHWVWRPFLIIDFDEYYKSIFQSFNSKKNLIRKATISIYCSGFSAYDDCPDGLWGLRNLSVLLTPFRPHEKPPIIETFCEIPRADIGETVEVDITSLVDQWLDKERWNYGFVIIGPNENCQGDDNFFGTYITISDVNVEFR